jgi:hypothetical protein
VRCLAKGAWFGIAGIAVLVYASGGPALSQVTYAPVPPPADQAPAIPKEPPPASVVAPPPDVTAPVVEAPAVNAPAAAPTVLPPVTIEPVQPAPTETAPAAAPPVPAVEMPTPAKVGEVLKDVAKGDVKALRRGPLLIHGNYCGIGNRPGKEPVDALDAACMRHDACTNEHSLPSCACDNRLRNEAMAIAEDPATTPEIKALATTMAASMVVLICK